MPDGRWKTKQADSLDLARNVEAMFKVQAIEQSCLNIYAAPCVNDIWDRYLSWAKVNKRSWRDDLQRWQKHIEPHLSDKAMDRITPSEIQEIVDGLRQTTKPNGELYAPATVKQVLVLVKRVYNWAIERDLYKGTNPCRSISIPRFDNTISNPLTLEQLRTLNSVLNDWKNERVVLVVRFALFSGKRLGEILDLTWDDIDFERQFITYRGVNTKNRTSQVLPYNNGCEQILTRAMELKISKYVFPSNTGAYYYNCFKDSWKRIRKKAGIAVRFHDLRHTYASYLASSGKVDIYTLTNLLGHKTISMTQRYAHLINGALLKGGEVADEVFTI